MRDVQRGRHGPRLRVVRALHRPPAHPKKVSSESPEVEAGVNGNVEAATMAGKTRKEQLEEMLAEDPNDPFLRYGLAMEHVSAGDDEQAVRHFRELLTVDANYVPAYQQAGQALVRLGRPEEARDVLRRGIAVAQKQGNPHAGEEMQGLLASLDD
jgi:Flp pilus assembly protein TadD